MSTEMENIYGETAEILEWLVPKIEFYLVSRDSVYNVHDDSITFRETAYTYY
jgi:hypothetical protein